MTNINVDVLGPSVDLVPLDRAAVEQQFGALCLRRNPVGCYEILLITTRQTKRWTIPKGWPIRGLKPHRVAEREAWEEVGVEGRAKKRAFGHFRYIKILDGGEQVWAQVEVHILEVMRCRRRFPERKQRTLVWLPLAEAEKLVKELDLQRILRRLDGRLQAHLAHQSANHGHVT